MKKKDWKYRSRTERDYEAALKKAAEKIISSTSKLSTIEEITAMMLLVTKEPWFKEYAYRQARHMVKSVIVENARTWREAARKGQRGHLIHRLLRSEFQNNNKFLEMIEQNAGYIKTLPQSIATDITKKAAKEAIAGRRTSEIVKSILSQAPDMAKYKAERIARTEVAKTQASVTETRSLDLGIVFYVWRTSEDQRVRGSHKHMDGVICSFKSPPSPEQLNGQAATGYYNPGNIYNCRCYAEPIMDISELRFPVKIVYNGQIQKMGKKDFLKLVESA